MLPALLALLTLTQPAHAADGRLQARPWLTAEKLNPGDFGRYADAAPQRAPLTDSAQRPRQGRSRPLPALESSRSAGVLDRTTAGLGAGARRLGGSRSYGDLASGAAAAAPALAAREDSRRPAASLAESDPEWDAQLRARGMIRDPHWCSDVLRTLRSGAIGAGEGTSGADGNDGSLAAAAIEREIARTLAESPIAREARAARRPRTELAKASPPILRTFTSGGILLQQGGAALLLLGCFGPIRRRLEGREADPGLVDRLT